MMTGKGCEKPQETPALGSLWKKDQSNFDQRSKFWQLLGVCSKPVMCRGAKGQEGFL